MSGPAFLDMTFERLAISTEGPILRVTLNRPDARNALDLAMCRELRAVFEGIEAAPSLRIVRIDAAGPVFCAGADLKERKGKDEIWVRQRRLASFAAYDAIERSSKVVVCVVDGPVVGSGGEIAMASDFIIASERTNFTFPEAHWGTVGATQRLQRVVGKRLAKELLFTARRWPVEEAHAAGLVNRVVVPEALEATVAELLAQIAKAPALALTLAKQSIELGEKTDLATGIRIELAAIERALADSEWRKGLEAFAERDAQGKTS
ncbi:enoyl-CoA hydratase/isomerase family protein [Bosea sp. 2KB_26]|uniref:enoyl-CoA hydratase/isomerase family protein n=1 Tax=Bosea sp. 2KB_26 TaxID=3237475 RepID=UPI003F906237